MPILAPNPRFAESLGVSLGFDTTPMGMLRNAERLRANLELFRWPESWPERPESLTHDDLELSECHQKLERGEKLSKEDAEQMRTLSIWRQAVHRLENQAMGRLRSILGAIYTFELDGHHEEGQGLRRFVQEQYRCNVPDPCLVPHYREARTFADYFGRNLGLFPLWLRTGVKPPEGKGYIRPKPTQRRFSYAPAEED